MFKTNIKVIQYTIDLLKQHNVLYTLCSINLLFFIIGIIENYLFLNILNNISYMYINNYIYMLFGKLIITNILKQYSLDIVSKLRLSYKKSCLEKYKNLSHESKEKINEKTFNDKMDRSWNSIMAIIVHGSSRLINIFKSIYLVIMSFFIVDEINRIILISVFYAFYYYVIFRKMAIKRMNINNKLRNDRKKTEAEMLFKLPFFKYNMINISDIMSIYKRNTKNNNEWDNSDNYFTSSLTFQNNIGIALIIMNNELKSIAMLITVFKDFNDNIIDMIYFADWFRSLNNDFITYEELYNNTIDMPLPEQLPVPTEGLVIDNVCITRGGFELSSNIPIRLAPYTRILIQGESGGGKSTFIDGILGKIKGVHLSNNIDPIHYQSQFIELYQKVRENLPTSNITIREMFFGAEDSLINECLTLVKLNKKITNYDCDLNDEVSGGEKMRLCIAIQLYRLIITNNDYIFMDEPEQGSDHKLAYEMIYNIMERFNDKCFIIVSHLENINNDLCKYKYNWSQTLSIENGVVSF